MGKRQLPDDFKEFIQCLNRNNVRYMLVGGWAVGIYGNPGATKDIDFLIAADPGNVDNLQRALSEFGVPTVDRKPWKLPPCSARWTAGIIGITAVVVTNSIILNSALFRMRILMR